MPEETRERIVSAAYEVLARDGYDTTTVKDIAAAAGVAPGLVHYYFKSKEELVLAAIAWACHDHAQPVGGSPEEQALNAFARSREELSGPREFHRLLFDMFGVGMHNPAVAEALRRFLRQERDQIERLAREVLALRKTGGMDNGGPREIADFVGVDDVPAIAAAVWGGIFGIHLQSLVDPELDAQAAMDAFTRMVMTST
ncbi:MAG TPA: helix-turn-helix domain-containing protein [Candidatus Dormibacteraeota bacterium]